MDILRLLEVLGLSILVILTGYYIFVYEPTYVSITINNKVLNVEKVSKHEFELRINNVFKSYEDLNYSIIRKGGLYNVESNKSI